METKELFRLGFLRVCRVQKSAPVHMIMSLSSDVPMLALSPLPPHIKIWIHILCAKHKEKSSLEVSQSDPQDTSSLQQRLSDRLPTSHSARNLLQDLLILYMCKQNNPWKSTPIILIFFMKMKRPLTANLTVVVFGSAISLPRWHMK